MIGNRSCAAAFALALAGSVPIARAESVPDERTGFSYGVAAGELTIGAVALLNAGTSLTSAEGAGLVLGFTPIVIGPLVGILAHRAALDPRPALAFHAGLLTGLDLFMLGAVIDGRAEPNGLRIGPAAIGLAVLGTVGGGYLAATQIDDAREMGGVLIAPFAGTALGMITGAFVAFAKDDARSDARMVMCISGGLALGIAGSFLAAASDRRRDRRVRVVPVIQTDDTATMISLGGTF